MKPYNIIKTRIQSIGLSMLFMISSFTLLAGRHFVTSLTEGSVGSLDYIITNQAQAGDTVYIDVAGIMNLSNPINLTKDIVIIGPSAAHFSIDYNGISTGGDGVFTVLGGGFNASVSGIKFEGGASGHAVSIGSAFTGEFRVKGCLFEGNANTVLNIDGGNFIVEGSSFFDNNSPNEAGACLFSGASLDLINCTFYQNSANTSGGSLELTAGSVNITHCTFNDDGVSMTGASEGKSIRVNGATVKLRNNLIIRENGAGSPSTVISLSSGTITSDGGNVTTDPDTGEWSLAINDLVGVNSFAFGNMVTDGWGLKYFPFADNVSPGINIDDNPVALPLYDQRRVWRVMDDGFGSPFADAGAVEYTPLAVTSAGTGPGSLSDIYENTFGSLVGKQAFVFEIPGIGPFNCPPNNFTIDLNADSVIFNGFSQNGSRIPGPRSGANPVTAAYTPITIVKGASNVFFGLRSSYPSAVIAGVSVGDGFFAGIEISNFSNVPSEVSGCHIGVTADGMTALTSNVGVLVRDYSAAVIGGKYCGQLYHSNRNVISGNDQTQVRVISEEYQVIKGNFIGLNSSGMGVPTGVPSTPDTGISSNAFSTSFGMMIGGQDTLDGNFIGDMTFGVALLKENARVFNNFFGVNVTRMGPITGAFNDTGIFLHGWNCMYNKVGEANAGNVVVNHSIGIEISNGASYNEIYANTVGVAKDGLTLMGNSSFGIEVLDGSTYDNRIGAPGKGNIIGGNDGGILLEYSQHSIIRSNLIGFGKDTLTNLGNLYEGIWIRDNSSYNMIGGCGPGEGNFIGNGEYGIRFTGLAADNDTIMGNFIGVNKIGGNAGNGIAGIMFDAFYNFAPMTNILVGDVAAGCGNEIAYNGKGIVTTNDGSAVTNSQLKFSGNSIHNNLGMGIDLEDDNQWDSSGDVGFEDNDVAGSGTLWQAVSCGTSTTLIFEPTVSGTSTYEVFIADSDNEEGDSLIFQWTGVTSSYNDTAFVMPFGVPAGTHLVATCTKNGTSTSEFTNAVQVEEVVQLTPGISHTEVCFGGNTYPSLTTTGAIGTPVWFWDAGLTQRIGAGDTINSPEDDLFINGPGTFNYYVADSVPGCYGPVSVPVTLDVIAPPNVTITGLDTICAWTTNQYVVDNISGATYDWYFSSSTDQTASSGAVINAPINTNTVTIGDNTEPNGGTDSLVVMIDSAGCIMSDTLSHTMLFAPFVDAHSFMDPETCGGTEGAIFLDMYEVNTPMTLYYNSGAGIYSGTTDASSFGVFTLPGLTEGTYVLDSITNGLCTDVVNITVTLTDPIPPTASAGPDVTICEGSAATLTGTGSNGSGSYDFAWDNGGGTTATTTVTPLVNTTFVLTITDVESICTATDTVEVTVTPSPVITITNPSVICDGNTHTYSVTVTNVTSPSYNWTASADFADPTSMNATTIALLPGTYTHTLTVNDVTGCSNFQDVTMTVNPTPLAGNPLVTDVACFGDGNGSIMLAPSGTYTFDWTGPGGFTANTQDINSLDGGTYNLTMTDVDGCTGTFSAVINEPVSALTYTHTSTDVVCSADGTITFSASGGTSPYQFSIDNGGSYVTSSTFTGLVDGTYNLSVIDANGCVASGTAIVNPSSFMVSTSVTSNYNGYDISCNGFSDGEVTAVASGGVTPYSFSIDGGFSSNSTGIFTGLSAGPYTVDVIDNNGCTTVSNITVTEPTLEMLDTIFRTDPTCAGNLDGTLEAVITGGPGIDHFEWYSDAYITWVSDDNPYTTGAGTYYVSVFNVNSCAVDLGSVTISDPPALFAAFGSTHETCSGLNDGTLYVQNVSGGGSSGGFSTEWFTDPGGTSLAVSDSLELVPVGNYSGTVTDANGCTTTGLVTVNIGETYNPSLIDFSNDTCVNSNSFDFGDDSGNPASGATNYLWSFANATPPTSTSQNPSLVIFNSPGLNMVTYEVQSGLGCIYQDTAYISIVDTAELFLTATNISCFGADDGAVLADAIGGAGGYMYSFNSGTFSTTDNVVNQAPGLVTVVVEDANGCQSSVQTVNLTQPDPIEIDSVIVNSSCGFDNGSAELINITGGNGGYSSEWFTDSDLISSLGTSNPLTGLAAQTYYFQVTDALGCTFASNVIVTNNGASVPLPSIDQLGPIFICEDGSGSYGQLTATSNDVSPGTFSWYVASPAQVYTTGTILNLDDNSVGDHYIYVSESNGVCDSDLDSVLIDYQVNDAVLNSITEICLGSEVNIDISTAGNVNWTNAGGEISDTTSAVTTANPVSVPSTYYFTNDLNGCIFYDSITLVEDVDCDKIIIVTNAFSPDGDGVNDLFRIDANALLSNENTVTIINRWGDIIRVYHNYDNQSVAWDGTNENGNPVTDGTYFYVVEIPALSFKESGWIQVVR